MRGLKIAWIFGLCLIVAEVQAQDVNLLKLPIIAPEAREEFVFITPSETPDIADSVPSETPTDGADTERPEILSTGEDFIGGEAISSKNLDVAIKTYGAPYKHSVPINPNIWQGLSYLEVMILLQRLNGSPHHVLNTLLRDILLAEGGLPQNTTDQEFLWLRANTLARLGMIEPALRLLEAADHLQKPNFVLREELWLQQYDITKLCTPHQGTQERVQPLRILCLLVAKKYPEASLQAQLLQEISPESVKDNYLLLTQLAPIEIKTLPIDEYVLPHPLAIMMATTSGITPRFAPDTMITPAVARMLLQQPEYPLKERLELAEQTYQAGFIGVEELRKIQIAQQFSANEYDNAAKLLLNFPSKDSRALGIQALYDDPSSSMLVLSALEHGDLIDDYLLMLDLLEPELRAQPRPEYPQSLALARAYFGLNLMEKSRQALPENDGSAESWLLHQLLYKDKPQTSEKLTLESQQDQEDFLKSLIFDEEIEIVSHTVTSWQEWYQAYQQTPRLRDIILALLPSFDLHPDLEDVTVFKVPAPTKVGLALLEAMKQLQLPPAQLQPETTARALGTLRQLGFSEIAQHQAARLLAVFLRPRG